MQKRRPSPADKERAMTYEKAVKALISAKLLSKDQAEEAVRVLEDHSVEFTYPDWTQALVHAGLVEPGNAIRAEQVMEEAAIKEAKEGGEDFDNALRGAGIL
jgi:hypothetical protein